jgi:hypothetical protein
VLAVHGEGLPDDGAKMTHAGQCGWSRPRAPSAMMGPRLGDPEGVRRDRTRSLVSGNSALI